MNLKKLQSNEFKYLVAISLMCFVYGYLITFSGLILNNILTIVFIFLSILALFTGIKIINKHEETTSTVIFLLVTTFAVNFFMILGTASAFPVEKILWVKDSYDMHIPGSIRIMELLQGKLDSPIVRTSIYDRTYLAHIFGAIFFAFFGVNQIASSLSLLIPKIFCAYFIFKGTRSLLGFNCAKIAVLMYSFLPTAIFYTITFYKEATLQMFIAMILYFIIKLYNEFKIKYFFALMLLLLFLGNERHYLVPCFAISALCFAFLSKQLRMAYKVGIVLTCIIGYKVFTSYYWDIEFTKLIETLTIYQSKYSSYGDVSAINKNLPYPIGVVKLLFTPFITPIKLTTYSHYATLLTWGSLVYHILVVCFVIGFYKIFKTFKQKRLLIILMVPFMIFLLTFGYVAPYNGRLRDSFLPLIVMIASYPLSAAFKKIKNKGINSRL